MTKKEYTEEQEIADDQLSPNFAGQTSDYLAVDPLALDTTPRPIAEVLRHLASQEGCDGEPYDQMMIAAAAIEALEAERRTLRNAAITATERAEAAEAERDRLRHDLNLIHSTAETHSALEADNE